MALPELVTRSVLDVVTENFERVQLKSFACRIVYAGDHFLDRNELIEVFRKTVDGANAQYCDIQLSGIFLAYDGYFVHVLEGSEDTINRQLRFLLRRASDYEATPPPAPANELDGDVADDSGDLVEVPPPAPKEAPIMFKRLKLLIAYHSIIKKTIKGWCAVSAKPPTLLTKFDPYGNMALHIEQLRQCLTKINKLVELYNEDNELSFEGLSASDTKMQALPEFVLLELLLDSKHIVNLRTYAGYHRRVDDHTFYHELVWPLPTHYTPRHLYKLKVDDTFVEPLPVQEWQIRALDREREEEEEGATSAESSD